MIKIDGNNNIVINDIYDSQVVVNYNDFKQIENYINQITTKLVSESNSLYIS